MKHSFVLNINTSLHTELAFNAMNNSRWAMINITICDSQADTIKAPKMETIVYK